MNKDVRLRKVLFRGVVDVHRLKKRIRKMWVPCEFSPLCFCVVGWFLLFLLQTQTTCISTHHCPVFGVYIVLLELPDFYKLQYFCSCRVCTDRRRKVKFYHFQPVFFKFVNAKQYECFWCKSCNWISPWSARVLPLWKCTYIHSSHIFLSFTIIIYCKCHPTIFGRVREL